MGHTKQKVEGTGSQCVRQNLKIIILGLFFLGGGHIFFVQGMKRAREERGGVGAERRGGAGGSKNTFYRVIKSICKRKNKK